jgi:ParB family transcriptional regulator, chromosome partitioning protein
MPEIRTIALTDIAVAKHRLRMLRAENVIALAQSMADQGLLHPIVVRPNERGYDPIAGIHRLEAAKQLNWTTISCIVLDDIDADQAELIEIDENLIRAELSPAERSMHIGKRKKLYEKLHPETRATKVGGPGRAKTRRQIGDDIAERFTKDTAKKSNRPERSVQRDATRAKKVVVLPDIVGTSLDNGAELDALAKLPEVEQRSLAAAAKRGEQVSAITMPETPADPKSDVIGEVRSTLVRSCPPSKARTIDRPSEFRIRGY